MAEKIKYDGTEFEIVACSVCESTQHFSVFEHQGRFLMICRMCDKNAVAMMSGKTYTENGTLKI